MTNDTSLESSCALLLESAKKISNFQKCVIFHFLDNFFFCKHFYYITGFCKKKFNFCKFANFLADSKSRAQELSNDVSFVIFGHQTWDLGGGGSN